jgi:hypothetical protein
MAAKKGTPRQPGKRPYRAPRLTTYGTLTALTKTKGSNQNDSGGMPKSRTSGGA